MSIIGLTGSISTGKSTASSYITSKHKIPVVDCDLLARQVVLPGTNGYTKIVENFGRSILNDDKTINRTLLGQKVFGTSPQHLSNRRFLNSVTHREIRKKLIFQTLYQLLFRLQPVVILDVPLLFESKLHHFVHKSVCVYVPSNIQLERLQARDKINEQEALNKIKSQMSIETKKSLASIVWDNSGSKQQLYNQIDADIRKFKTFGRFVQLFFLILIILALFFVYNFYFQFFKMPRK